MQQHWLNLTLLVVTGLCTAHGRTIQSNKDFMTSFEAQKDADEKMVGNNLDLDNNAVTLQTPSSAVQDWSLVCQQLCGAALGGAVCAPYCENLPILPFEVQFQSAEDILDSKQDLICPELCGLQLGDDVCTCKKYITDDVEAQRKIQQENNVCAIFCDHNNVTLTGCTPCKSQKKSKSQKNIILNRFQNYSQKEIAHYQAKPTSTPNWRDLCAALCKTGDGGSLCNCDLSPFRLTLFKNK